VKLSITLILWRPGYGNRIDTVLPVSEMLPAPDHSHFIGTMHVTGPGITSNVSTGVCAGTGNTTGNVNIRSTS
jgi:hypothetical protein